MNAFGFLISLLVVFNFRAEHIRSGTFDFFEQTRWTWLTPVAIGLALGSAAGLLAGFRRSQRYALGIRRPHLYWAWPGLLLIFAWVAYQEATVNPIHSWSAFAPTRHLALLSIAAVLVVLLGLAEYAHMEES